LRFGVLGPLVASGLDGVVELGPTRQRTVLAALLIDPTTAVTPDQLVDRVWGDRSPQRARATLHTYLSRLRTVFEAAGGPALVRRGRGYLLDLDPLSVDLHQFRKLATAARAAGDTQAVELWREALDLWRGTPFDDLDSDWLRGVAIGLERERWSAGLDRNDVLLRSGDHAKVLADLTPALAEHPLDERLAGQFMLALYASGRQADALAHYRMLRQRLVDDIGSEPGPALRELHHRLLHQDPQLVPDIPAPETPGPLYSGPATRPHRPAELPADVAAFAGRHTELHKLDGLLDGSQEIPTPAISIVTIGGTAGVGKTALAVHWAHQVADLFPDGQLYVNLRGYDPEQPMTTGDALARFLVGLGVPDRDIPVGLDERAARFRTEVAGKRLLILLDNAAAVAQVRMLLPGTGTCLVVVTSRDSLAGLVAIDGAYRLDLELLPVDESLDLLGRLIGRRAADEPEATALLAEQCARLPLALRVAAELAVSRPDSTLAELSAELTDRQSRLDLLDAGGDPYAAVREVISWSIHHLPATALETFRLLGLHPGPDVDPYSVAALTGAAVVQARQNLAHLARAHLVHRAGPGRYGLHDLLRAYAGRLAATELTQMQRDHALRRLLDYYRTAATTAMDRLHPAETDRRPAQTPGDFPVPTLSTTDKAEAWLDAERFNLVAVAVHAATGGDHAYLVDVARVVHRFLIDAHVTEAIALYEQARSAAERAEDPAASAHALRQLGTAYSRLGRLDLAVDYQREALTLFRQYGDRDGETRALAGVGVALSRLGRLQEAIDPLQQALTMSLQAGDSLGEAIALNNLGVLYQHLGRYAEASEHLRLALNGFRDVGARPQEANTLTNLGVAEAKLGRYPEAARHLDESLTILKELSAPPEEAHALDELGRLLLQLGEVAPAVARFSESLEIYHRIGARSFEAYPLNGLGEAAFLSGDYEQALHRHGQALIIAEETGTTSQRARAHVGIGQALRAQHSTDDARTHFETALALYEKLGIPEAQEVRQTLTELQPPGEIGASG